MTAIDELADVLARAHRGEPEAFEWLVDAYSARLYGFLYRLTGHRDDAEELVQEVFVRVVRHIEGYDHDGRFEAWIFRIATNLVRDRIRRVGRRPEIGQLADVGEEGADGVANDRRTSAGSPSPEAGLELADDVERMQWALDQLPAAEREVIMLRHYSQLSFADIAQSMETPLGTALARAHRGLAKLRRIMDGAS
ncbi:MAG: RNA polymerase sigma factor [Phycisphaerae bacterium]